ncbi:MAG: SDR family oxidoreductase [Anaerolineae bacterium]|nr:MAG: SDR family oxidoreductase [Anaerolineae bacterium]
MEFEETVGDITDDPNWLAREIEGHGWVFHMAAVSDYWRKGVEQLYQVNVEGTKNIAKACRLAGIDRLIFTSSVAAFGIPEKGQVIDENCSFNIRPEKLPYGHSKYLAELEVAKAIDNGLDAVILNPTITLGPRDVNMISGSIITEAARGLVRFNLPGGGNFVGVEDVVRGHLAAAANGQNGENYILAGENLSHKEVGLMVFEALGRPQPRLDVPTWFLPLAAVGVEAIRVFLGHRVPVDGNQVRLAGLKLYADGQKAKDAFGLETIPIRAVVEDTYQWYKEHGFLKPG